MKKFLIGAVALSSFVCVPAQALNITFVGDSITQGGRFNSGLVPSYRYQLFKNFVDNGVTYTPMGMTVGASQGVDVSSLTPTYRGVNFSNVSESAASARAYQYSGHASGGNYRADPGTVADTANRGPVTVKLGLEDPFTGTANTYYDGAALKTYSGDTYASLYGNEKPEVVCIMIGINDLYDMGDATFGKDINRAQVTNATIANYVHGIVDAYQEYNPNVRIHLFELLPTGANNGTGTNHKNNYSAYNEYLRSVGASWSTETSKVTVDNISTGFYAENGAMIDTIRGAHPNAQGELIVAGNIARVLGIGQRTAGLERKAGSELASQVKFASTANSIPSVTFSDGTRTTAFSDTNFTRSTASLNDQGHLVLNTALKGGSDYRYLWNTTGAATEFTVEFSVKMNALNNDNNAFGIIVGNGVDAGVLYVKEAGIYWNRELLYGSATVSDTIHSTFLTTFDFSTITISWVDGEKEGREVATGFYIWLNGQLIGDACSEVGDVKSHADKILFGDIGDAYITSAELSSFSFELGNAYSAIPEPSAFGLLAGLGALALVGTRRRRR